VSSFSSDPQSLSRLYAYSMQIVWSAGSAPVGTFKLQGSDDPGEDRSNQLPTNWTDITSSSQAISGTPGSILYDVVTCSYRWTRLVYTATSGSATVTSAQMNAKGV
jgi:hypothetical protein